jgi:hypothetical protein
MTSDSAAPQVQHTESNVAFGGVLINRLTQAAVKTEPVRYCIMLFTQLLGHFGAVSTQRLGRPWVEIQPADRRQDWPSCSFYSTVCLSVCLALCLYFLFWTPVGWSTHWTASFMSHRKTDRLKFSLYFVRVQNCGRFYKLHAVILSCRCKWKKERGYVTHDVLKQLYPRHIS